MIANRKSLVLFLAFLAITSGAAHGQAQNSDEGLAWHTVLRLQDEAEALYQSEKNPGAEKERDQLHNQRVAAFDTAASAVSAYISKYALDKDLKQLRLTYRMAVDLELAEKFVEALKLLHACQLFSQYHDANAMYDGKRIDQLVQTRVDSVTSILETRSGTVIKTPDGPAVVVVKTANVGLIGGAKPCADDIRRLGIAGQLTEPQAGQLILPDGPGLNWKNARCIHVTGVEHMGWEP